MLVTLSSNWKKHLFTILNKLKMKYAFAIMSDKIKRRHFRYEIINHWFFILNEARK